MGVGEERGRGEEWKEEERRKGKLMFILQVQKLMETNPFGTEDQQIQDTKKIPQVHLPSPFSFPPPPPPSPLYFLQVIIVLNIFYWNWRRVSESEGV